MDVVNLLRFPTTSNAFTNYKPGSSLITRSDRSTSSSGSPPRKTARLEGDSDHSSSFNRSRDRGKGKEKAVDVGNMNAHVVKKLTVINPPQNTVSEAYLDSLLPKIHNSICAILDRPTTPGSSTRVAPLSYEGIYQATRSVVLIAGKGEWIYDKLRFELKDAVQKIAAYLKAYKAASSVEWLVQLVEASAWFERNVKKLEGLLTYLDRAYLKMWPEKPRIRPLARSLFRAHTLESGIITAQLMEGIKEWAEWERVKRSTHPLRSTIIALLNTVHTYSLFTPLFLTTYLQLTRTFYAEESERLSSPGDLQDSPGHFLLHCAGRIDEEKRRSVEVLGAFEWCSREIEGATERSLMEGRLEWLSKGIVNAMDDRDIDGLARMYNLFSRVDGLKLLRDAFKAHVHDTVKAIVTDTARDEEMIDHLLDLKAFIDEAIPLAFSDANSASSTNEAPSAIAALGSSSGAGVDQPTATRTGNRQFEFAMQDAFTTGFRARRAKPAELLAKHVDRAMRKGQRNASDAEFAKALDTALVLCRFTADKDVFRTFYHRALAKRLLLQRSASDDFEKAVLKTLKEKYDDEFNMGDQMFTDLALSRDKLTEFQKKVAGSDTAQQLTVVVLQRSFWPFSTKKTDEILLPPWMQADLTKYASFYHNTHQNHKLDFDHSLGTMLLRARFKAGEKELSVSLYQGIILLLFTEQGELGFMEIKEMTRMDDADVRRTLQSLACGKKKVLKKRPVGRDVDDTDTFYFNADFTDAKQKVHINSIQTKETPEETKHAHEAIEGDRKHYLDAAIVRIMKAKKSMSHQRLIPATIEAVKGHFNPEVKVIKERIEQLIEQEYIRRDDEQDSVYVYVA